MRLDWCDPGCKRREDDLQRLTDQEDEGERTVAAVASAAAQRRCARSAPLAPPTRCRSWSRATGSCGATVPWAVMPAASTPSGLSWAWRPTADHGDASRGSADLTYPGSRADSNGWRLGCRRDAERQGAGPGAGSARFVFGWTSSGRLMTRSCWARAHVPALGTRRAGAGREGGGSGSAGRRPSPPAAPAAGPRAERRLGPEQPPRPYPGRLTRAAWPRRGSTTGSTRTAPRSRKTTNIPKTTG
jgi:hypothetical protein